MDVSWIKSPTGRRVIAYLADPRPAWLWSADGQVLLWRNLAARYFQGRTKKNSRPAPEAVPLRGQIARLIRLGTLNRASLSRMQFIVGERPVSATCSCMPLLLESGETGMLVVDVDPISADFLGQPPEADDLVESLFPPGWDYLLIDDDMQMTSGSRRALASYAGAIESEGLPELDTAGAGVLSIEGERAPFIRFTASPQNASLLLFSPSLPAAEAAETPDAEPVAEAPSAATTAEALSAEPLLPIGLPPVPPLPAPPEPSPEDHWVSPADLPSPVGTGGLRSLFDRLVEDEALYTPLRADEDFVGPVGAVAPTSEPATPEMVPSTSETPGEAVAPSPVEAASAPVEQSVATEAASEPEAPRQLPEAEVTASPVAESTMAGKEVGTEPVAAAPEAGPVQAPAPTAEESDEAVTGPVLYRLVGRGFTALAEVAAPAATAEEAPGGETATAADAVAEAATAEAAVAEPPTEAGIDLAPQPQAASDEAETPDSEITPVRPDAGTGGEAEPPAETAAATPDAETVERVSRYNFDELGRILADRVGNGNGNGDSRGVPVPFTPKPGPAGLPATAPEGSLVTLGGETLVLNRLPLGILVFRDQQVLFANRAITEMVGYDSVEGLRAAGLAAIFPAADDAQESGPVNHLVQRDGTLVPVTARLQSVSWQGKPALMLSASATEVRTGHEAAVRAFAATLAMSRADGFIELTRAGVLSAVSADTRQILDRSEEQLVGRPISAIAAPAALPAVKEFLERPARFAETARPAITFKGSDPDIEIMLFAQGQAGIINGYFGFVRRLGAPALPALAAPGSEVDPALLGRLSRGVRRPLNTVIGFSDLIGTSAFGQIENERYVEYARDIKTAGLEIAALVDELDDFARLRDGRYVAHATDVDLGGLLDSSVTRVRGQANALRVLVRSAISERLPRIRADRASLAQAILNLLASAIDQTPQDGSVVLSAQMDDAGGVSINIRDSGRLADMGERFVVFRDGVGRDGEVLTPVRSSVGLALTRALLAVNGCSLSVDPAGGTGTLFSLSIPPENIVLGNSLPAGVS